ncbi:MAG TPA: hypothetical protein VIT38_08750 [Allosphingosinicella sp.]
MTFRLLAILFAALAFAAPLYAQSDGDPPLDPDCPRGDLNVPRPPGSVCIGRLTGDYAFSFIYPRAAVDIPAVDAMLREQAVAAEAWINAQVAEDRAQHAEAEENPPRLTYEAGWTADAVAPEIAAFSGTVAHYTGGAHGGREYETILFERRAGRPIVLQDLFEPRFFETSLFGRRLRGMQALQDAFCRELTRAQRERRDNPEEVVQCPAIEGVPVTLVCSSDIGRITAFLALLNPYVAGSWSEGPYEIQIPIDAKIMDSLWGRYRVAFGLHQESGAPPRKRGCSSL